MSQTTIRTATGKEITGEVVRRDGQSGSWADLVLAVATCGLSEVLTPDTTRTTVRDSHDNHWTGRER